MRKAAAVLVAIILMLIPVALGIAQTKTTKTVDCFKNPELCLLRGTFDLPTTITLPDWQQHPPQAGSCFQFSKDLTLRPAPCVPAWESTPGGYGYLTLTRVWGEPSQSGDMCVFSDDLSRWQPCLHKTTESNMIFPSIADAISAAIAKMPEPKTGTIKIPAGDGCNTMTINVDKGKPGEVATVTAMYCSKEK
jgi:hypothetical protein